MKNTKQCSQCGSTDPVEGEIEVLAYCSCDHCREAGECFGCISGVCP